MFRVIDTIHFNSTLYGHHPEWWAKYRTEGLLACLDLTDAVEASVSPGTMIRVHRPDGSTVEHRTTFIERTRVTVGLFFPDLTENDIPRTSTLEPIPTPNASFIKGSALPENPEVDRIYFFTRGSGGHRQWVNFIHYSDGSGSLNGALVHTAEGHTEAWRGLLNTLRKENFVFHSAGPVIRIEDFEVDSDDPLPGWRLWANAIADARPNDGSQPDETGA